MGHKKIHNVDLPSDIPRRWIDQVRAVSGVRRAEPYLIGVSEMSLPSGGFENCVVVGVEPTSLLGNAWNLTQGSPRSILQTDGIFIDECEQAKLEDPHLGDFREIGGRRAKVVGKTRGIMGFLIMPYVFTTIDRATDYLHKSPRRLLLLPGAARPRCQADRPSAPRSRRRVPELDAYPREVYSGITVRYWITRTGLGIIFRGRDLAGASRRTDHGGPDPLRPGPRSARRVRHAQGDRGH